MNYLLIILLLPTLALVSCNTSRGPFVDRDSALIKLSIRAIKDAVPREDPITRAGNKNPYTVLGKTYHLLPTSKGYKAAGVASWYGTKFQGRPTANGEPYNLYGMTAAHAPYQFRLMLKSPTWRMLAQRLCALMTAALFMRNGLSI